MRLDLVAIVTALAFGISQLVLLIRVVRAMGRLEFQLELLWSWYLAEHPPMIRSGRRASDSLVMPHAHDRGLAHDLDPPADDEEPDE